jgi:ATP-dependent Clp protease protease subunit
VTIPGWPSGPRVPGTSRPETETGASPLSEMLETRLFDQRVIVVSEVLSDAAGNRVGVELMSLDAMGDDPITLQLSSPGGSLDAAMSVMDIIELAGVPVNAVCTGVVGGAVIGVLAVCAHRAGAPHSQYRVFEPPSSFAGAAREAAAWAAQSGARWEAFCARVGRSIGQDPERIHADAERRLSLSAADAFDYGLLTEPVGLPGQIVNFPKPPIGFRPR